MRRGCLFTLFFWIAVFVLTVFFFEKTKPDRQTTFRTPVEPAQLNEINGRTAGPVPCIPKRGDSSWPVAVLSDPEKRFAAKVRDLGATGGSCGILELDRELVDLAIQIAIAKGTVAHESRGRTPASCRPPACSKQTRVRSFSCTSTPTG
jgi:hypothetical protein